MKELTTRQNEILGFIQIYFRSNQTWPSIREIQSHFDFKSTNAVMGHIKALERKGFITRVTGQARTFRVTYDPEEEFPEGAGEVVDLPLYGSIPAGFAEGVESGGMIGRVQIDSETAGLRRSSRAFALKVRGESMIDAGIFDGDVVIVEPGLPNSGDVVAALIDNETTLKRFIQRPGDAPYLKAENRQFPELHPVSELIIQGVVKALVRNLK